MPSLRVAWMSSGMYAGLPYAMAQGDCEVPYIVIQAILYSIITYFMMQLDFNAGMPCHDDCYVP